MFSYIFISMFSIIYIYVNVYIYINSSFMLHATQTEKGDNHISNFLKFSISNSSFFTELLSIGNNVH